MKDLLSNLLHCPSPVARGVFSSKMSLLLFAEASVTPVGDLFACTLTDLEFKYFFVLKKRHNNLMPHSGFELQFFQSSNRLRAKTEVMEEISSQNSDLGLEDLDKLEAKGQVENTKRATSW